MQIETIKRTGVIVDRECGIWEYSLLNVQKKMRRDIVDPGNPRGNEDI